MGSIPPISWDGSQIYCAELTESFAMRWRNRLKMERRNQLDWHGEIARNTQKFDTTHLIRIWQVFIECRDPLLFFMAPIKSIFHQRPCSLFIYALPPTGLFGQKTSPANSAFTKSATGNTVTLSNS